VVVGASSGVGCQALLLRFELDLLQFRYSVGVFPLFVAVPLHPASSFCFRLFLVPFFGFCSCCDFAYLCACHLFPFFVSAMLRLLDVPMLRCVLCWSAIRILVGVCGFVSDKIV